MRGAASIYIREGSAYVSTLSFHESGARVPEGDPVEVEDVANKTALGGAAIAAMERTQEGVGDVPKSAAQALLKVAGVRSERAFYQRATLVTLHTDDHQTAQLRPWNRTSETHYVPVIEDPVRQAHFDPAALGEAILDTAEVTDH